MSIIVANASSTAESIDDRVAQLIQNGGGITWTYDDANGTLTPAVDHGGLDGLADDDHSQYFMVNGRSNEHLTMSGTGKVRLRPGSSATNLGLDFGSSESDTGIWLVSANILGLAAGGVTSLGIRDSDVLFQVPAIFFPDNTLDIGALAGNRPRDVHVGRDLYVAGTINPGGQIIADGTSSATAPAIAFDSDANTGLYLGGADQLRVSCGGTDRFAFNQSGFNISSLPLASPQAFITDNGDPGAVVDSIAIGAKDTTVGNARTVHLRTEEAVTVSVGLVSTHELRIWINNVQYKLALTAV